MWFKRYTDKHLAFFKNVFVNAPAVRNKIPHTQSESESFP
jgi:hypothetical protein